MGAQIADETKHGQSQGIAPTTRRSRRSVRLKGYDYSQAGMYFVTSCCQDKACLFGEIRDQKMFLNNAGEMIFEQWLMLSDRFVTIQLHEFIEMPNNVHGILEIVDVVEESGQPQGVAPTAVTLGNVIGAFKSVTTHAYINGIKQKGWARFDGKLWQRNFWEHVIRNEESYLEVSEYIQTNPIKWRHDELYVSGLVGAPLVGAQKSEGAQSRPVPIRNL